LPNRRAFDNRLKSEIERWRRYPAPFCAALFDLDHLSAINGRYFHTAGDAVIRTIGLLMSSALRAVDLFARIGGDELAALLPGVELSGAQELGERLRSAVDHTPIRHEGHQIHVTVSAGFAVVGKDTAVTFEQVKRAMAEALHDSKVSRNCCAFRSLTCDNTAESV
jgi:two-component system, cell cycle response regulator